MAGRELDREELTAGSIIASVLGGEVIPRDTASAPPGTHDLDLVLPDGQRVAVEVTSAGDEAQEALRVAALARKRPAPSLDASWWIGLPSDGTIMVDDLVRELEPLLGALEKHGVTEIGGVARGDRQPPADDGSGLADVVRSVFALRISFARRVGPAQSGETAMLILSLHQGVGSDFDKLNELIAKRATAKADELLKAEADKHHLFVWIRASASGAELAMATLPPPSTTPEVPAGIDAVWAATSPSSVDGVFGRLWRVRPPGPWEILDRYGA